MLETVLDTKRGTLKILGYDGSSAEEESICLGSTTKNTTDPHHWEFFRTKSNHSYTRKGGVFYEGDCRNNLIISSYAQNRLVDVRNAFIFVGDSCIEISPISNLRAVISKGLEVLSSEKINYNIPERVFRRENLPEVALDKLSEEIKKKYGIEPRKVSGINSRRSKNGVYHIIGKNGHEYVVKYKGKNKTQAELISTTLAKVPIYFPRIYPREDCEGSYTFDIDGILYGLEDCVKGESSKERNLNYFDLIGNHIALLHEQLSCFVQENTDLGEILLSRGESSSESNIASTYLDLAKNRGEHSLLLSQLEEIINESLSSNIRSLPKFLIHRDLNHSNIIWVGEDPKIIDSETIGISERINDFVAPLLLLGGMRQPKYLEGSLPKLIDSYNRFSKAPLSKEERHLLPVLLKYYLLKYYVVRTIRRNMEEEGYLNELKKTLLNLGTIN